jgi:site-specific recombinase XerD
VERAGIPYETDRGQVDRKILRKTFGTHLAMAGVDLRVAVKLMRHSDPGLTMNVYTDPMLLDMEGAVARVAAGGA